MRKRFFIEPSAKEIKELKLSVIKEDLIDSIEALDTYYGVIIDKDVIPLKGSRNYMKHGNTVGLQTFDTLEDFLKTDLTLWQLRRDSFNGVKNRCYVGYTYQSIFSEKNKQFRRVSLVECLEGAKLYAYLHQECEGFIPLIDIVPYADESKAEKKGAYVHVTIPSREKGNRRYTIMFESVPLIDTEDKRKTAMQLSSTHACKYKEFFIGYSDCFKRLDFCCHDIAAYFALIENYAKEGNIIPFQECPFAVPTQKAIDFYRKLGTRVLIKDSDRGIRKLTNVEKEVLLFGQVYKKGHDALYFPLQGKVKDYDWGFNNNK
jgi:hypothetical protein